MKLKTNWRFTKWKNLNIAFVIQHIHNVLRNFTNLQIFFYITKWNNLNIAFVIQHIHNVLRNFTNLQIFFYIYTLKWGIKWRKCSVQSIHLTDFYLKLKNMLCSWLEVCFLIFYKWSYSQRCFDVVQRCGNRHWTWQRCFDVV